MSTPSGANQPAARTRPNGTTPSVARAPRLTQPAASPAVGVRWLAAPQKHDYRAAGVYLSLMAGPSRVRAIVAALKKTAVVQYQAKDILRAAGLALLPEDDADVARDLAHIRAGQPLSPCLVISGDVRRWRLAQIADGYHRVCAAYYTNEDTYVPVKIVKL